MCTYIRDVWFVASWVSFEGRIVNTIGFIFRLLQLSVYVAFHSTLRELVYGVFLVTTWVSILNLQRG